MPLASHLFLLGTIVYRAAGEGEQNSFMTSSEFLPWSWEGRALPEPWEAELLSSLDTLSTSCLFTASWLIKRILTVNPPQQWVVNGTFGWAHFWHKKQRIINQNSNLKMDSIFQIGTVVSKPRARTKPPARRSSALCGASLFAEQPPSHQCFDPPGSSAR